MAEEVGMGPVASQRGLRSSGRFIQGCPPRNHFSPTALPRSTGVPTHPSSLLTCAPSPNPANILDSSHVWEISSFLSRCSLGCLSCVSRSQQAIGRSEASKWSFVWFLLPDLLDHHYPPSPKRFKTIDWTYAFQKPHKTWQPSPENNSLLICIIWDPSGQK